MSSSSSFLSSSTERGSATPSIVSSDYGVTLSKFEHDSDLHEYSLIKVDQYSTLGKLLTNYIALNLVLDPKDEKPTFNVHGIRSSGEKRDRVELSIGLGHYRFLSHLKEEFEAIYESVDNVVGGGDRGAELLTSLFIATKGDIQNVKDFFTFLIEKHEVIADGTVRTYIWDPIRNYWMFHKTEPSRSLTTIVLPNVLADIIVDIDQFLNIRTKEFYTIHGIPYSRNYLFHGVSGSGKTSLIKSLTGHFRKNLCYVDMSDHLVTNLSFSRALNNAPIDSIIVLENIDVNIDDDRAIGFMNALDDSNQIIIMTAKSKDIPILTRIDKQVEFTYLDKNQIAGMFMNFYPKSPTTIVGTFVKNLWELLETNGYQIPASVLQNYFISQMGGTGAGAVKDIGLIVDELTNGVVKKSKTTVKKRKRN